MLCCRTHVPTPLSKPCCLTASWCPQADLEASRATLLQRQRALEEAGSKFDAAKLTAGCTKAVMEEQLQAALSQISALTTQLEQARGGLQRAEEQAEGARAAGAAAEAWKFRPI